MKKTLSIVALIALVAVLAVALVACIPSDPDKAVENLEAEGYEVEKLDSDLLLTFAPDGCVAVVSAVKGITDLDDNITIYYFEDTDSAKAFYEEAKEAWDKLDDEDKEGIEFKQSGKIVYSGTEAAVKAAK